MDKLFEILERMILTPRYTFWGLALLTPFALAFLWGKVKEVGIFKDVAALKNKTKTSRVEQLTARKTNDIYLQREKELFEYESKVIEYQTFLKTNESHLPTLIYLNGYQDTKYAIDIYNNSKKFLKFLDTENKFELVKPIDESRANFLATLGAFIFFSMSIGAYFLMIFFLYLYEVYGVAKNNLGLWVLFNFILMLMIIFLAMKIMRFFMKRKQALNLLQLKRIDLSYKDYIDK